MKAVTHFGQVPELHVLIEGFFAGIKSLLDLDSQLLATEGVVEASIDGFHRRGKRGYGGTVINALENNVRRGKETVAGSVKALVVEHKAAWIDDVIRARDALVHPIRGAQQLMFEIPIERLDGSLVIGNPIPPHVGSTPISRYAAERLGDVQMFSGQLLRALRPDS